VGTGPQHIPQGERARMAIEANIKIIFTDDFTTDQVREYLDALLGVHHIICELTDRETTVVIEELESLNG
jgi:hypothetical protein